MSINKIRKCRKFSVLCLLLVIALSFSACSGGNDSLNPDDGKSTVDSQSRQEPEEEKTAKANEEAEKAYMAFLNGEMSFTTGENIRRDDDEYNEDGLRYGTYDYYGLKEAVKKETGGSSETKYALVDFGQDGINEMVIYLENVDLSCWSWTGILHYNGESLELNGSYIAGYRTYATLQNTGYKVEEGAISAAANYCTVSVFDEIGAEHTIFKSYVYLGALATSFAYVLHPDGSYEMGDYTDILEQSRLNLNVYESAEGEYKIAASEWSQDAAIRAREEALVEEIISLGVETVSYEEMEKLVDTSSYTGNEVEFEYFDDGSGPFIPVAIKWDMDDKMDQYEYGYEEFTLTDSAGVDRIVLEPQITLLDFKLCYINLESTAASGENVFSIDEILYTMDFTSAIPLVVNVDFANRPQDIGLVFNDMNMKEYAYEISADKAKGTFSLKEIQIKQ